MRKFLIPAFAAALSFAGAAQATTSEQVSVQVPYADLDLATPAGAATLQTRIAAAVKSACEKPDTHDMKAMAQWEHCVADATDKATRAAKEKVQLASL